MITILEISQKLQSILNGTASEIISLTRPSDFQFVVATEGLHLDKINDKKTGKNFIPVFISQGGGEYDAVPNLNKSAFSMPITFYFPVRFKNDFYALNEFLSKALVGKVMNWGTSSGYCLSTISVATFGEIQGLDLKEFKTWVENLYQEEVDVREYYMSMEFTLYLTTADDVVWGNQVEYKLQITYDGVNYPTTPETLRWDSVGNALSIANMPQQLIGEDYVHNTRNITSRGRSIKAYMGSSVMWQKLLLVFNGGTNNLLTNIKLTKIYHFNDGTSQSFTFNNVVIQLTEDNSLGVPISFTFTMGDL